MRAVKFTIGGSAFLIGGILILVQLHSYLFNWALSAVRDKGIIYMLQQAGSYFSFFYLSALVGIIIGILLIIIGLCIPSK